MRFQAKRRSRPCGCEKFRTGPIGTIRVGLMSSMRDIVMPLDVIEIDRLGDAGLLIQIQQIAVQIRVIDNSAKIALEVACNKRHRTG